VLTILYISATPGITLVTRGVQNIDDSIEVCRDGLRLSMQDREDGTDGAFFELDDTWLSLCPRNLIAEDAIVPDDNTGLSGVTLAHEVSNESDVETVLEEAEATGGRILRSAQEVFRGRHSAYFADPDSHLWEVAYRISPPSRFGRRPAIGRRVDTTPGRWDSRKAPSNGLVSICISSPSR
jgi:catechol 2,3-dioxygenase-like lactoylglutathione lyase family enzyme